MMNLRLHAVWIASALLFGCSFTPRYPNDMDKNVTINLHLVKNGGILTSAEAVAGINNIAKDCSHDYKGYITLSEGSNELGLAEGQPTLLVVEISHEWMGGGGSMQRGALIIPRSGARYIIDANYVDGMYDFRLYEVFKGKKKALEVNNTLPGCKS